MYLQWRKRKEMIQQKVGKGIFRCRFLRNKQEELFFFGSIISLQWWKEDMCCFSIGEDVGPLYWEMTKLILDIGLLVFHTN